MKFSTTKIDGKQQPSEIKVFAHESMQQALHQVQQVCNDSQKKKFSDLFSLLDTNEEPEVSRRSTGRGSKRNANRVATNYSRSKQTNKEESDEESSDEEVTIKPRTAKKRRKNNVVGSDSD